MSAFTVSISFLVFRYTPVCGTPTYRLFPRMVILKDVGVFDLSLALSRMNALKLHLALWILDLSAASFRILSPVRILPKSE